MRECIQIRAYRLILILASLVLAHGERSNEANNAHKGEYNTTIFTLIVSSDPQLPWWDSQLGVVWPDPSQTTDPGDEKEKFPYGENNVAHQYTSMVRLMDAKRFQGPLLGAIVNGDLTAYGHDDKDNAQLSTYKLLVDTILESNGIRTYLGLGNHDYVNNMPPHGSCGFNGCSSQMVKFMSDRLEVYKTRDSASVDFKAKVGLIEAHYSGSMAYSFNTGNLHIVQLQVFPTYNISWRSSNIVHMREEFYEITPSLAWLVADLEAHQDYFTIVNMHDYGEEWDTTEFDSIVVNHNVGAVFAGHIHEDNGLVGMISNRIPVFRSGSSSWLDYLLVTFDFESVKPDLQVNIKQIVNDKCGNFNDTGNSCSCHIEKNVGAKCGSCFFRRDAVTTQCMPGGSISFLGNNGSVNSRFASLFEKRMGINEYTNETFKYSVNR